jgi:CRP-like cAMP-binding protein
MADLTKCLSWGVVVAVVLVGVSCRSLDQAAWSREAHIAERLAEVELFAGLSRAQRMAVAAFSEAQAARAGQWSVPQGEPVTALVIAMDSDGEARIADGTLVGMVPAKTPAGELEFLIGGTAIAGVKLVADSELIVIPFTGLRRAMDARPRLGYVIMERLARIEAERLRALDARQAKH